jgi:protease-4
VAWLRRLLVGLLATIGAITVLVVLALVLGGWWLVHYLERGAWLPDTFVLVADLRGSLDDRPPRGLTSFRLEPSLSLSEAVLAIDRAAADPRVKGLVARLDDTGHGFAAAQELRDAVGRFRESGRPAVAFADSFGELGPGNEGYYLATAFEQINLQPVGLVGLTGLIAEVPFARELLDRVGIEPSFGKREAYKSALDSLTETGLTPANREMLTRLLNDLSNQLVQGIATGRSLDEAAVRSLLDGGPYAAEAALERGLVDRLAHWDEVLETARGELEAVELGDYARASSARDDAATEVALVRGIGPITRGEGDGLGDAGIAADELAGDLSDAIDDPDVTAILLRVDSPGGSAVASETIARQVRRAKAAGKPVVVAMGNAAASGGYWISMDATSIVAQPATLTGSIGVIAGKPVLSGLWDQLEVRWAQLPAAANADMWSVNTPYSELGRERLGELLDAIYGDFKAGVAAGRSLPAERVDELAQGRVWTGAEAKSLGLVDHLGGLVEAQDALRTALGLEPGAPLELRPYPAPRTPFGQALELLRADLGPMLRLIDFVGAILAPGNARMPPFAIR